MHEDRFDFDLGGPFNLLKYHHQVCLNNRIWGYVLHILNILYVSSRIVANVNGTSKISFGLYYRQTLAENTFSLSLDLLSKFFFLGFVCYMLCHLSDFTLLTVGWVFTAVWFYFDPDNSFSVSRYIINWCRVAIPISQWQIILFFCVSLIHLLHVNCDLQIMF